MINFNKKVFTSILLAGFLLLPVQPALAKDFSKMKVKVSDTINADCKAGDGYEPVWGCFINNFVPKSGQETLDIEPTIYLRKDLPSALFSYVFFQNVGQYIVSNYSDEELAQVFNPAPNQKGFQDVRRAAATTFAYFALGGTLTPAKLDFFAKAMAK